MDDDGAGCGALGEAVVFLKFFEALPDPRQRAKVIYPLDEILLLCLLAVLAGAETVTDMARFGEKKLTLLRRFRPFVGGTPAHDHLGDILASLDAQAFQRCFVAWVASLTGTPAEVVGRDVIAIDGKTSRRSGRKAEGNRAGSPPLHTVSAFAARQRLVLGQVAVAEKSNEIVAIPKLLTLLAIEGAVVTIDAMGCQRAIARTILDNKADYVLALKGNQGTLRDDVDLFLAEQRAADFQNTTVSRDRTVDGDHGRIETRTTTVIHEVTWLRERHAWPGLNGIVVIDSLRETGGTSERLTRLYLTSLTLPAQSLGAIVRSHWAIENSLHWVMDMVFRDDECRLRSDNAPANFTTLRHIALNLTRAAPGKDSLRLKRKVAAWDDDFLAAIVAQ